MSSCALLVGAAVETCTENCPKGSWVAVLLTLAAHTLALFQGEGGSALQYLSDVT